MDFVASAVLNIQSRNQELKADMYALELGYGIHLRNGLIRVFGANLDNIFITKLDHILHSTHQTLEERLNALNAKLKEIDCDDVSSKKKRKNKKKTA